VMAASSPSGRTLKPQCAIRATETERGWLIRRRGRRGAQRAQRRTTWRFARSALKHILSALCIANLANHRSPRLFSDALRHCPAVSPDVFPQGSWRGGIEEKRSKEREPQITQKTQTQVAATSPQIWRPGHARA
jgi:hypothetical protein